MLSLESSLIFKEPIEIIIDKEQMDSFKQICSFENIDLMFFSKYLYTENEDEIAKHFFTATHEVIAQQANNNIQLAVESFKESSKLENIQLSIEAFNFRKAAIIAAAVALGLGAIYLLFRVFNKDKTKEIDNKLEEVINSDVFQKDATTKDLFKSEEDRKKAIASILPEPKDMDQTLKVEMFNFYVDISDSDLKAISDEYLKIADKTSDNLDLLVNFLKRVIDHDLSTNSQEIDYDFFKRELEEIEAKLKSTMSVFVNLEKKYGKLLNKISVFQATNNGTVSTLIKTTYFY